MALDIRKCILDILSRFNELKQKGCKFYDEKGNVQTYYI
jgi:arabinogalactan endo-1,4-beta-galactosidase